MSDQTFFMPANTSTSFFAQNNTNTSFGAASADMDYFADDTVEIDPSSAEDQYNDNQPLMVHLDDAPIPEAGAPQWAQRNRTLGSVLVGDGLSEVSLFVKGKLAKEQLKRPEKIFEPDRQVNTVGWGRIPESRRTFYNDSYAIFQSLRELRLKKKDGRSRVGLDPAIQQHLEKIAGYYQKALERYYKNLLQDSGDPLEMNLHLHILMVWHLFKIVNFPIDPTQPVAEELMQWIHMHEPSPSNEDGTAIFNHPKSHEHSKYWAYLCKCVLRGLDSQAKHLLQTQLDDPALKDDHQAISEVQRLIETHPRMDRRRTSQEFQASYRRWLTEIRHALPSLRFTSHLYDQNFRTILSIMSGQEQVIFDQSDSVWEALASYIFWSQPTLDRSELGVALEKVQSVFPPEEDKLPDKLMAAIVDGDVGKTVRLAPKMDLWLVAHLTDLLEKKVDLDNPVSGVPFFAKTQGIQEQYEISLRDFFIRNYAEMLVGNEGLWRVGVEYLVTVDSGGWGKEALKKVVIRHPIETEHDVEKILSICVQHGLSDEMRTISRAVARKHLDKRRYGPALLHYMRANDAKRVTRIAELLLEEYLRTGDLSHVDIVQSVPKAAVFSDRLAFLLRYHEFHTLYRAREFEAAGRLLVRLLESGASPKSFWPVLLVDAIPLLEGEHVVFNPDQTYELMRCLEELTLSHRSTEYLSNLRLLTMGGYAETTGATGNGEELLDVVRIALCRNLARAMVVFGDEGV